MSGAVKRVRETCDVTKVTYYMYSCDTCCMSREMMEMDSLDTVSEFNKIRLCDEI